MSNEQNESDAKAHPVDTLVKYSVAPCKWCGYTDYKIALAHQSFNKRLYVVECYECSNSFIPVVTNGFYDPYKQCREAWNEANT